MPLQILLASILAVSFPISDGPGTISGAVLNRSEPSTPLAATNVILQVQHDEGLVPLAQVATDDHGQFVFRNLSVDDNPVYLVGAVRDGVFHPGERVQLSSHHPFRELTVSVYDAVTDPSPLLARRHEINICIQDSLLQVSETIWISNPSSYCYVGRDDNSRNVTLRLHIPSNFEKVTFQKEFFGRRFMLIDGALVTTIPWPPGERELAFTYFLPIEQHQTWTRPLDLPCSDVHVSIASPTPKHITCNLPRIRAELTDMASFGSGDEALPAGHPIRIEFGRMPVSYLASARWIALGVLAGLIATTTAVILFRSVRTRASRTPTRPNGIRAKSGQHTGSSPRASLSQKNEMRSSSSLTIR